MTAPTITALPPAPSRSDPANFATEADAFLGALPDFGTEINALGTYLDGVADAVDTDATNAASSASAAANSALQAASAAASAALEASPWVSGASYSSGDVVWSAIDYGTYRAKTTHSGETVDPSADSTNWAVVAINTLAGLGVTATANELNTLDGITASTAELNILDGVTATTAEINLLDGVTATTAEINLLDGLTASTAELNILDGVTASTAEINKLDNATFVTGAGGQMTFADGVNDKSNSVSSSSGTANLDCSQANTFVISLTENTTFVFNNPPSSGSAYSMTVIINQDSTARTITWPASVIWNIGVAPTAPEANETDVLVFTTTDAGSTWYGFQVGNAMQ